MNIGLPGAVGKLPLDAEFIHVNDSCRAARQLDEWFQQGLREAMVVIGREWPDAFNQAKIWRFVFIPPKTDDGLVGVWLPSHDIVGRLHPFFVFRTVEGMSQCVLVPIVFQKFFEAATAFVTSIATRTSLEEITMGLQSLPQPEPAAWETATKAYNNWLKVRNTQDFWADLFGGFEDPRKYTLYDNLLAMIDARDRASWRTLSGGVRFPLLKNEAQAYSVILWLQLVKQLSREALSVTAMFWPTDPQVGDCLVVLGDPPASVVTFFFQPHRAKPSWFDLAPCNQVTLMEAQRKVSADRRNLLAKRDLSLEAFIKQAR